MDIEAARTFIEIVKTGSFVAAATNDNWGPPTANRRSPLKSLFDYRFDFQLLRPPMKRWRGLRESNPSSQRERLVS